MWKIPLWFASYLAFGKSAFWSRKNQLKLNLLTHNRVWNNARTCSSRSAFRFTGCNGGSSSCTKAKVLTIEYTPQLTLSDCFKESSRTTLVEALEDHRILPQQGSKVVSRAELACDRSRGMEKGMGRSTECEKNDKSGYCDSGHEDEKKSEKKRDEMEMSSGEKGITWL